MQYRKSLEIEQRLDKVLKLVRRGRYSAPALAEQIGVSIPTISRCVQALRERGHEIRSELGYTGWHYVLVSDAGKKRKRTSNEAQLQG